MLATVVSVRRPASARRGDRGIVTADGRLVGWVGGACSEPAVVREALRALAEGTTRLLRICPPGSSEGEEGVVVAESSCASEGTVEVLIEPQLPQPAARGRRGQPGGGDAARARRRDRLEGDDRPRAPAPRRSSWRRWAGATPRRSTPPSRPRPGYVGLVASAKRAGVELAALRERGLDEETLARVRSPAGLDLGPLTQPEIAVAVLAELVAWRHDRVPVGELPVEAVDPVCGMTVAVGADTPSAEHEGTTYWFCCPGCRGRFARDPAKYLASA